MARNRSADFLPEVFKTNTNKEFLSSTLDQLTQEPKLKQTQGFIGKKINNENDDSYIIEPTAERSNYQLEAGIVFKDTNNKVSSAITYPEMLDALKTKGANVTKHDRLFSSSIYSWSPLIDFDKFVNYGQYYWLPGGTDSVDVSASDILLTDNFDVSRNDDSYTLSGIAGTNPTITLARGGEYTFTVNQPGYRFYIQSEPGASGVLSHSSNISSRDVEGVTNNGEDGGVVTFAVPEANSQQFYYDLTEITSVDLATFSRFDSINGKLLSQIKNIDGIADLNGKTIVFLDTTAGNSVDLGWQYLNLHEDAPFEAEPFEKITFIDSQTDRYSVYQIEYIENGNDSVIKLNKIREVNNLEKFDILYGETYSNKTFYKNTSGYFQQVPLLTSAQSTLYYQDASDETKFGIINLVDSTSDATLNINTDIIKKKTFTSPNGVEFTNGLKVMFRGNVNPTTYQDKEYYVEGVGTAIKLIAVTDFITPEKYTSSETEAFDFTPFDSTNFDGSLNSPIALDFITINRASIDLNPWTRSNRWVHKDVINKTAEYNNTVAVFDNNFRANRPIIEFHANTKLFNFGTESKSPVTAIDFNEDDAFSNINGSTGFSIDGVNITNGARVIFANDNDSDVKNKIYDVSFVDLEGNGIQTVKLTKSSDGDVEVNQTVVCTNGATLQGETYYFDGIDWIKSQQKTAVNQAPLFDVYDLNGLSFSDATVYPNSTFKGTKIFGYGVGTGPNDKVLGFPLSYLNIDNLGDIVFDNSLYTDTFTYGSPLTTKQVSDGYVRKYSSRTEFNNEIGWTKFVHDTIQEQVFNFTYNNEDLILDILPKTNLKIPSIKVYINEVFVNSSDYTVSTSTSKTTITLDSSVVAGSDVEVNIISDTNSDVAYYKVPKNLENNPFNENSDTLTLGTIRNHYTKLAQNLLALTGEVNGANNIRDLGSIEQYGDTIIQNSSPIAPMAKFLDSDEFDFFKALEFNANAYEKYKIKVLDYVANNDTYDLTASVILDHAMDSINVGKTISSAFYKSDMMAGVDTPTITTHTVTPISTSTFNSVNIYDFTKANNKALLVYLNDNILVKDRDYTVSATSPNVTILVTLAYDDVITIKEYETTNGSHIPNTPTKLGLHPKYEPKKYLDNTSITPINVIRGHDGSITVAYNDIRDDVLLEFESRIFNNIKIDSKIPIRDVDVIPGKFRDTEFTDAEITSILSSSFLNWVGWNRLNYKTQDFATDNELTWNYSNCSSKLDNSPLKGHWRGVYKHYYDTDTPHTTPWQMLGFSQKPAWWEDEYGVAPYTNGNLVLWDDLENGLIKEPGNNRVDERFKRENLTKVIPVDSEGNLLNPFVSIVTNYSRPDFKKSWVFGDHGPVENAWRRSSSYIFALQRLYALTKPAQYFALSIDRDKYKFNTALNQYLFDSRYRLDVRNIEVQTTEQPKHSYVSWIADYHNNNGCPCVEITEQLSKVDVRLCYRMASFTDKNYLKIFTDKSTPDSSNASLLIPDQSYDLLLHKNQPLTELQYSAVIVQKTDDGYSVFGHSKTQQYFEIYQSVRDSKGEVLGDYIIPKTFTKNVTVVPYGYVFTSKGSVIDFLVSYGAFLESKGLVFNTVENSNELNWGKMAQEFLSWSAHDWGNGSIVNLNPCAMSLEFNKELLIVNNINASAVDALDQNGLPLTPNDYVITRLDNSFKVATINNKSFNFLKIKTVSYEHLLVLDNISVFNDLIYKPVTGLRQQRLKLIGFTTFEWNGQLDAQGFILNQDNVEEWKENTFYSMGNIVKFKNAYWSAIEKLEPANDFNFDKWAKIDYNSINKGLIPNIANKAKQINEYYNKKTTNLESDVDLLAMGLIGFRPRSYLNSLGDVSQVSFYTDFIGNKGTKQNADVFRNVKFNKKVTDYEIFENWAISEATYGSSDNKVFVELDLDSSKLYNNPSIIEIVSNTSDSVSAHQQVKLNDIYNQSKIHTNENIFPTRTSKITDTNLPSAGYVRTNDIDIALFTLSELTGPAGIPFANTIKEGTLIWVAKDNSYDWNVYRAGEGSNILTSDFGIAYSIDSSDWSVITADSEWPVSDSDTVFYKLTSVRIPSTSNLTDTYINSLPNGSKVWVDSNTNLKQATYHKINDVWELLHEEQDVVDTTLVNRVLMFDKDTQQTTNNLDYIDPLNGKVLGAAAENIDYISADDPASYNQGTNITSVIWGDDRVGDIWWDTSNVRFLNYNQSDLTYSSKNWGLVFPGSTVDIRQWVKSTTPPTQYNGNGTVVDPNSYTTVSSINASNTIVQYYYFWVTDLNITASNKTLDVNLIKQYITNPITSGVPFIAFLNNSAIGMYNSQQYINNSILHVSYNQLHLKNTVFNEYSLIRENNKYDFLSDSLYRKLQDSFVGGNSIGLAVPDPKLNIAHRNGISYRPRQSMFENRFDALQEYLTQVNGILKKHIITANKSFELLEAKELMPGESSNKWDLQVADLNELNYQNLDVVGIGYKYLVLTDSDNNGGWSIYEVVSGPALQTIQIQTYDTTRAWEYIDWYETTEAENAIPVQIVSDSGQLTSLSVPNNSYVKVSNNSNGKFEIYQSRNNYWIRVGLEDGTIKFSEALWGGVSTQDNITVDTDLFTTDSIINTADKGTGGTELRNVIKAINDDLLIDELLIERNKLLISVFNYILSEQGTVNWLTKTSLIDVEHKVRDLKQYSTYKKDNQDFLLEYLNESKPYHTRIKEFLLKYDGSDQYNTVIADFDVPAYYDTSFNKYISPVLDYDGAILKSDQSNFDDDGVGLTNPSYNIWKLSPWDQWYNNRTLSIKSVTIVNAGINYTQVPTITVSGGGATTQATMTAKINNSGQIIEVIVDNEGAGYTSTPTITVSGNGTEAIVTPVMQNTLVRNLNTTIKYNRCEYDSTVVEWVSNTTLSTTCDDNTVTVDNALLTVDSYDNVYNSGQLVRHNNKVYTHNVTRAFKTKFLLDDFTEVSSETLTAADRTMGYYIPGVNAPGLNLPLLINGTEYPGVLVESTNTTEDDNSTYSNGILDAEYASSFVDLYLGTNPEDINTNGGEFIDTYSSHAPEELVPGSVFDTLNLVVHTRPGFDYQGNGHGFEIQYNLNEYNSSNTQFSFEQVVAHPITIKVVNVTTGTTLVNGPDYSVDWVSKTVDVTNNAFDGDKIQIFVYEIGGGNQLYRSTFNGDEVHDSLTIPVASQSIYDIVIMVNGVQLQTGFTSSSTGSITVDSVLETADSNTLTVDKVSTVDSPDTTISFSSTYDGSDFVAVTVFGFETVQYDYSYPITTSFTPYGADSTLYTADSTALTTDIVTTDYDLSELRLDGKNIQNAIVEHNGKRLRPPEAKRYIGDDLETNFRLPTVGGVDHTLVSSSEIVVFVDDEKQTLSTDYTVITVIDGTNTFKEVSFVTAPSTNTIVDVYVASIADYTINNTILNVKSHITVSGLDNLCVTTWHDTSQIDILTSSFKGPTTVTAPVIDLFDASGFDSVGFDFVGTSSDDMNLFDLGRDVDSGSKLWVTLNKNVLLADFDYSVVGSMLLLAGDLIGPTDIVTVTSFGNNAVPDALSFRLFKDMNGNSAMYKVNTCCLKRVELIQPLSDTDDIIYLNKTTGLTVPNLELGTFGIIMIDNERITYRDIDTTANTISGLRRGTAGTAIKTHDIKTPVHDVSIATVVSGSVITSETFGSDTNSIASKYDKIWYASGNTTVSNGIALQNQETAQAHFVKIR